jgi:hypothetical protein
MFMLVKKALIRSSAKECLDGERWEKEKSRGGEVTICFFFFFIMSNKDEGEKGFEKIWRIIYRHMV